MMNQPSLPDVSDTESPESTHWYILTDGKPVGPIFFSRLRQMARQGKLSVDAQVRKGKTGVWVRAGDLTGVLFPHPDEVIQEESPETKPEPKPQPQVNEPGLLSRGISSIRDRFESLYDGIRLATSEQMGNLRAIVSWLVLIAVFGSLFVIVAQQISFEWPFVPDALTTFSSIWDELKAKRDADANSVDWDAFVTKARKQIEPIVARLQRTASSENRLDQQLCWAGRDYLPKMLNDSRTKESDAEQKFAECLQRARWLKQGKDLNGRFAVGSQYGSAVFSTDLATIVFGVLFVIFDIAIVVWFIRGRKTAKA